MSAFRKISFAPAALSRMPTLLKSSIVEAHSEPTGFNRLSLGRPRGECADDGPTPITNPYLAGNFAPVRSEDDFELEVTGQIPAELTGAFYRNGPNPQFEPRDAYHWFSGDGMIHGFFVEDGKVATATATPHAEMGAGARRRQGAVRHLRQPDDRRSVGDGQGQRHRQHQYRLARRQAAGARGSPQAVRARSGDAGVARLWRGIPRQGDRASEARSRNRRDGLVRLLRRAGCASNTCPMASPTRPAW